MKPGLGELRYRPVAQALHWIIAISVIGLIILGLMLHHDLIPKPERLPLALLHISVGLSVLGLMVLRLLYRWRRTPPPLPEAIPRHEQLLAALGHWSFYALLLAVPVFGILFVEGAGHPVKWFGVFTLPRFVGKNAMIQHDFAFLHFWGGIVLIGLIVVHVGAAALHHWRGHKVLHRMLPRLASDRRHRLRQPAAHADRLDP